MTIWYCKKVRLAKKNGLIIREGREHRPFLKFGRRSLLTNVSTDGR